MLSALSGKIKNITDIINDPSKNWLMGKSKIHTLEKEIERQSEEIERRAAQNTLERFMSARLNKRQAQAMLYFTENAAEQERLREFALLDDYDSFRILNSEKLSEEEFRFAVESRRVSYVRHALVKSVIHRDAHRINSAQPSRVSDVSRGKAQLAPAPVASYHFSRDYLHGAGLWLLLLNGRYS